jgi:cation:H+ antiporter
MTLLIGLLLAIAGLGLVIFCAEKLVSAVVGTSLAFGLSAFIVSVLFVGFDPENLVVGAVGTAEGAPGIALGSIVGAAMVAAGLAFGLTALVAPMRFEQAPRRVLILPILAILIVGVLALDGLLSRMDGVVLLGGFALAVLELIRLSRKGLDVRASGELAESLARGKPPSRARAIALLIVPLAGLVVGSEFLVAGSQRLMTHFGISGTVYGMTILALAVSVEELARELPAALRGRPEISVGNVVGSVLAFFLFNAGVIALVRPVPVDASVLRFYLPLCLVTVAVAMGALATLRISRPFGTALVTLYIIFFVGAYVR